jgi:hypothetical protein
MLVVQERSRFSLLVCICYRMIPAVLMKVMGEEAEETTNLQVPKKTQKQKKYKNKLAKVLGKQSVCVLLCLLS